MVTAVRTPRREQILHSAAALFAERGFHAVGVDDIGAAAGISGPGVYRHFAGKQAVLESLVDRAMTQMLDGATAITDRRDEPRVTLEALVDLHVRFAVEQRSLIGVWVRESRSLSDDVRRSLRGRMRAYEQTWHQVLAAVRPGLAADDVAVLSGATLAMLNGTAFIAPPVGGERLCAGLRRTALGALLS